MDYEKKYEKLMEAVKVLRDNNPSDEGIQNWVNDNVPELKESDDESIRKGIIDFLWKEKIFLQEAHSSVEKNPKYRFIMDAIAWLEKQKSEPNWCHHKVDLSDCSEEYRKAYYDGWNNCNQQHAQLKAEQKPTDKVEPKFKVGDWVVFNGLTLYIKEVVKGFYRTISKGGIINSYDWNIDNIARLWTLQDSKPGDVLAFDNGTIVIFKDLYNSKTFHSYCHIEDGIFDVNKEELPDWWKGEGFKPATKEQRDTLMKAMSDAGYTFDFENRELKKIHVIDEGKAEMDYCFTKMMNGEKVSSAWSEEDEKIIQNLLSLWKEIMIEPTCCRFGLHKDKIVEWLKSLKDRVQPKWKPKGIHIEALRCVINGNNLDVIALKDLLEQLKKL